MREITKLKSKSVASNDVDVQDKITNGDKFSTEISEDVKTVKKVIKISILISISNYKYNHDLNINIINEHIITYDSSIEQR